LGKIPENLGKIPENPNKIPKYLDKILKIWAKMTPNVCQKTNENLFLEATPKKGLHDLCGGKFVGKSRTTTFWRILGKIPSYRPKFACSYAYGNMKSLSTQAYY